MNDYMPVLNQLQKELEGLSGKKLALRINQNRCTLLSIKREKLLVKVSLHQIFLKAPKEVLTALARYIQGKHCAVRNVIQKYIDENFRQIDYSKRLNRAKLVTKGTSYDLETIYQIVNQQYFDGQLNLAISWFGRSATSKGTRAILGLYYDPLKLIKIHRVLDHPSVPHYVLSFVIYHEMLHHLCPPYIDEQGKSRIHTPEFQAQERLFAHYKEATAWLTGVQDLIFDRAVVGGY